MPSHHRVSIAHSIGARRAFASIAGALGFVASATPGLAQAAAPAVTIPAPSTFQTRIEAAAQALANNPRLKGLTQQQRVERVEFVVGNTLVLLLHEIGHVLVAEFQLPVLGREEDAADTYAALSMLRIGTSFTVQSLADAAKGWFFDARRDQEIGDKPLYYDEHNVSAQRAYQIVCLMVGSDPEKFKSLADQAKMPQERQKSCTRDYRKASEAWDAVLAPHLRQPGQPETKISVVYGDPQGDLRRDRQHVPLDPVPGDGGRAFAGTLPVASPVDACDGKLRPSGLGLRHRHPHRHHVLRASLRLRRALPRLCPGEARCDTGGEHAQGTITMRRCDAHDLTRQDFDPSERKLRPMKYRSIAALAAAATLLGTFAAGARRAIRAGRSRSSCRRSSARPPTSCRASSAGGSARRSASR